MGCVDEDLLAKKNSEANETLDPMWVDLSIPHSALKGKKSSKEPMSTLFTSLGIPCSCACVELDLWQQRCKDADGAFWLWQTLFSLA